MLQKLLADLRHTCIKVILSGSHIIYKMSGGKNPKFILTKKEDIPFVGSKIKILEKTEDEVFISKLNEKGEVDNSDFKIMTATDLHLGTPGEDKNRKTVKMLLRQIKDEKPDLVIFTGDVILSDWQHIDSVQFAQIMEKTGVYWCYCFGNHETREEKGFYKYQMITGLQSYPHCLTLLGKPELFGYGNTAVHIKNSDGSYYKSLYLFDSGRNMLPKYNIQHSLPEDTKGYDYIKLSQIDWYTDSMARTLKSSPDNKSLCYMHIPLKEYENICDGNEEDGYVNSGKTRLLFGTQYESIGCSPYNSGLFTLGKEKAALQGVFAGHDHINDLCAVYDGVYLVYSQCTGYNTYNMTSRKNFPEKDCHYGVTLTVLHSDGSIEVIPSKNSKYL